MFPYWLLFAVFAAGAVTTREQLGGPVRTRMLFASAVILMTAMIGLRFGLGPDWSGYLSIFNFANQLDFGEVISHDDPGFYAVMWLVHRLQLEIWALNLICAVVFTWGLWVFAKRQPNPWLAVTVAIPYLVIVVAMSGIRQAAAIGFVFLGLAAFGDKKLYRFMFWVMCASLFHASALLMAVVVGLSYTRNRFQSTVLLCIAAVPGYFILSASFETYIDRYLNQTLQSEGTIFRVLMNFVPAAYLLLNSHRFTDERHQKTLWRNLAVLALTCLPLILFVPSSTALDRASLYIIPLQIYVLTRIPSIISEDAREYRIAVAAVVGVLATVLWVFFQFSTHGKYYIPYRVYPLF
jgi:hypothetical protein